MDRFAVPFSIRTMKGTVRPSTVVWLRSPGRWVGSASALNPPAVERYMYVVTVGAEQFESRGGPRPAWSVMQMKGTSFGPENRGGPAAGANCTASAAA